MSPPSLPAPYGAYNQILCTLMGVALLNVSGRSLGRKGGLKKNESEFNIKMQFLPQREQYLYPCKDQFVNAI